MREKEAGLFLSGDQIASMVGTVDPSGACLTQDTSIQS